MIEVIGSNIEKALRDLNKANQINGVISEKRERGHFISPSQKRAQKKARKQICINKDREKIKAKENKVKSNKKATSEKRNSRLISLFGPNM